MFEYQTYITDEGGKLYHGAWNSNSMELTLEMYLTEVSMGNGYVFTS